MVRMSLRPMLRLAQNCTECGQPLYHNPEAAGETEILTASVLARTPAPAVDFGTCPKCGKLVAKEVKPK